MIYLSPTNRQAYFEQVWGLVRQIPDGKVATYGQLAQMLPSHQDISPEDYKAFSPRWVGDAMATCPDDVPWHRVINSQGKISRKTNGEEQRLLLLKEGLVFIAGKLDLRKFQWGNPEPKNEPTQATLF